MSYAYRIIPSVFASPVQVAMSPRRADIEHAVADMGFGVVIDEQTGRVVAFHESHLPFVNAGVGNYQAGGDGR